MTSAPPKPPAVLPFPPFGLAGAGAGLASELVRGTADIAVVLIGVGGAALLGSVHWLGLRQWRSVRPDRMR